MHSLLRWIRKALCSWRTALALAAGVTLAVSFPQPGWTGAAWVAPGLLLLATLGVAGRTAFGLGFVGGLTHHLISLRWLLAIPFPAGAVAAWLSLSLYMALYVGLWVWLCWRLLPGGGTRGTPRTPGIGRARLLSSRVIEVEMAARQEPRPTDAGTAAHSSIRFDPIATLPWSVRTLWGLACAAAWVTTEILSSHLMSGFPWNPLAASQHAVTPLIQLASVTGVPGVSFLVVWASVALLLGGLRLAWRVTRPAILPRPIHLPSPGPPSFSPAGGGVLASFRLGLLTDLGLPILAILGVTFWGAAQLVRPASTTRELRLALVQPSIPQRLIWDPDESTNRFNRLMELSALALATRPDVLVWPEASLPDLGEEEFRSLTNLIAAHRAWMVFGADDVVRRPDGSLASFNSAFLFDPAGRYVGTYRKQRLVIFGEYVPLERWLPWVRHLTPIEGSFAAGEGPVPFRLTAPPATLSVLICFEDVFARGARNHVAPDTDFLLNLTNDGWFGDGAAQWQQAVHAAFRAVENGLPLVRCTNNGLTCWIDEHGRIREGLGYPDGNIYGAGFILVRIPLPAQGQGWPSTFYRRHGDVFGWGCVAVCALLVACRRWRSTGYP